MARVNRQSGPYFIRFQTSVAQTQTLSITLEEGGVVLVPTVGTFSLYDSTGTVVAALDGEAATSLGGTTSATYALSSADLAGLTVGPGYFVQWALTIAGSVELYEAEAILARNLPLCPITDADLDARLSAIGDGYELPANKAVQDYVDEAWRVVIARTLTQGVPIYLVTSMYSFREITARLAEYGFARDQMTTRSGATKWLQLYQDLGGLADNPLSVEYVWAQMGYRVDRDSNGVADTDGASETRPGVFYAGGPDSPGRGF